MNYSLIANSGIQFYSKEIEINLNDGFKQVFYEWFDEEQVEQVLEYAYEIKQQSEFVRMSDLLKYGFMDHAGNLLVEPNVITANPEVRLIHKGDITDGEGLFRMRIDDKNSCILEKYLNCWLPAPYYEIDQTGNFKLGPYNWCRFKIVPISKENGIIKANLLVAFDTHTTYDGNDEYNESPSFSFENEKFFGLCGNTDKLIDYCSGMNDWIRLYLMKLVYNTDDINKIPPQQPYKYSFLASYYLLISYLVRTANLPNIKLIKERGQEEINVEMIIDIGNSRTSAILFENSDFSKVASLKLQNFSKPLLSNGKLNRVEDSFNMRLAFSKVEFGGNMEGSTQFTWPSIVRLGNEAEYLSHEATNISFAKQTLSTYSSPKRYLWDYNPRQEEWRFINLENNQDRPPILKGISNYFNYDGTIDKDGLGAGANYSRKSLMTFAFLEILAQASAQVNSHDYREYNGSLNTPRRINKIILTCPTAMSKFEQKSLHSSLEDAIFVMNKFYNNIDSSRIPLEISIEPKLTKDSNDNTPWIFDEATCSQFVYLYSVLTERYKNLTKEFFDIYGKENKTEKGTNTYLTVGSLDIGAGTSDVTICSYEYNELKPSQLKPTPIFWDSFDYAGDDMLRVLINNILLEGQDGILQKELSKLGLEASQIYSKLFDFFGADHNRLSFKDRMVRRDFNVQVSVPIMYYFLNLLSDGEQFREISYDEIFAKQTPSQVVIDAFNEKMGIDLKSIRWTFDSAVMCKHIEYAMDKLLEHIAVIMYAYKCDIVLLSGRPTSLKVIRYTGFTVSYNTKTLIPNWVAYELTDVEVDGQFPRKGQFGMDLSFKGRQAMREDYSNSGWDKGHMCPAADLKWSEKTMYESFYLTNICPQNHELNSGDWLTLEKLGREWAKKFDKVYIICGPIITSNTYGTIGSNKVVVPDAFFKAFLTVKNNVFNTIAFIMPNTSDRKRIQEYAVSVNDLEDIIGIDIFTNIDDRFEEMVESDVYFKHWGL